MISCQPGNCSKNQEMANIVLMEVTTCNCPKDSRYLSIVVVFLKVPKKIKLGLNTATSYFFSPLTGDSQFFSSSYPFCIHHLGPKCVLNCLTVCTGFQHILKMVQCCQLWREFFLETFASLEGKS